MKVFLLLLLLVLLIWGATALSRMPSYEACADRLVVGPRDTLEDIAERCGIPIATLLAANPELNNNPDAIYPGLVLVIPRTADEAAPQTLLQAQPDTSVMTPVVPDAEPQIPVTGGQAAPQSSDPNIIIIDYTVQPGDTLFALALRYNTTVQDIMDYNPTLTDPDVISVGQRLLIPDPPI